MTTAEVRRETQGVEAVVILRGRSGKEWTTATAEIAREYLEVGPNDLHDVPAVVACHEQGVRLTFHRLLC